MQKIINFLKIIFVLQEKQSDKEQSLKNILNEVSSNEKLHIINESVGSYRDIYLYLGGKFDSRLAFSASFVGATLSISIALYSYLDTIYAFVTVRYFILYLLYHISLLIYLIFLYFPRYNYPIVDKIYLIGSARKSDNKKSTDIDKFLKKKIGMDFLSMYDLEEFFKISNTRFKFVFWNIILLIVIGLSMFIYTINYIEKKSTDVNKIENYLKSINSNLEIELNKYGIILDKMSELDNKLTDIKNKQPLTGAKNGK